MNLINLLKYQLGSSLNDQVSLFLNEQSEKIQKALDAILPSVMSVLVRKGSEPIGAEELLQTIHNDKHDGSMLNYLSGLFSGGSSTNSLLKTGERLSTKYLGNKQSLLVEAISNYSDIKRNSASTLIKMSIPLLLGVIGKQVKNQNLDHHGLQNLLSGQKGHIGASIPSGFAGLSIFSAAPKKVETIKTASISEKSIREEVETDAVVPTMENNSGNNSQLFKYLPFILAAILGCIVLAFLVRGCMDKNNQLAETTEKSATVVSPSPPHKKVEKPAITITTQKEKPENIIGTVEKEKQIKESKKEKNPTANPKPKKITTTTKKEENPKRETPKSNNFISDVKRVLSDSPSGQRIAYESIQFRGSSAILRTRSRDDMKALAKLMKKSPNVNIKIESDNKRRNISIKKALMDAGINRNRIETDSNSSSDFLFSFN